MHIVLGILGTIVTILVLLNQLAQNGIDLGGLNPFLWRRRRRWQKQLEGNPVYRLESPLDVTALLVTAVAKCDGDMSSDEKRLILDLFRTEFRQSKKEAAELLIASAYLLGNGEELRANLEKVLKPSLENFTKEQAQAAMALLAKVSDVDPAEYELKHELVGRIGKILQPQTQAPPKWS